MSSSRLLRSSPGRLDVPSPTPAALPQSSRCSPSGTKGRRSESRVSRRAKTRGSPASRRHRTFSAPRDLSESRPPFGRNRPSPRALTEANRLGHPLRRDEREMRPVAVQHETSGRRKVLNRSLAEPDREVPSVLEMIPPGSTSSSCRRGPCRPPRFPSRRGWSSGRALARAPREERDAATLPRPRGGGGRRKRRPEDHSPNALDITVRSCGQRHAVDRVRAGGAAGQNRISRRSGPRRRG